MMLVSNDAVVVSSEQSDVRMIFKHALERVFPETALRRYVRLDEESRALIVDSKTYRLDDYDKIYVIGGGKAGRRTATELISIIGDRITAGALNVYQDQANESLSDRITVFAANHPTPNAAGVEGAKKMIELLRSAD
jgi:glycerate 2-kinase